MLDSVYRKRFAIEGGSVMTKALAASRPSLSRIDMHRHRCHGDFLRYRLGHRVAKDNKRKLLRQRPEEF
jgi:hypothetical protein